MLIAALAFGVPNGAQAQVRSLEDIRSSGSIRVGVNPNFPPMSAYGMTNQLEGFDVDIARRIADALGVKLRLVPTAAQHRVAFLSSGRIDLALGALTQTPEREQLIDFTIPLHTEAMSVLTTDRLNISSWRELDSPDITLVNMRGNLSVELLKESLPRARTLLVDGNADTVRALAQGRADALVENIDLFLKFTEIYRQVEWRHLDDVLYEANCGIGIARGNAELKAFLDNLLLELHDSGYVNARWEHWFGAPMTVPVDPRAGS
ncbi:MAG: transporter substrate-binding domain-containing protein [Halieaceae bacterium]|nr:transporter substrate-binding domain-containing protein [Halieaceae bacterium]